jgi:nucleoside-diphosphate-sugar epimerase
MAERRRWKLPMVIPTSASGMNRFQFVHVDDVARVLRWTLDHFRAGELRILNLVGPGECLTLAECARLAETPILRLPSLWMVTLLLRLMWGIGLSGMPAEAIPYFLGSYMMDATRLREELGADYERVMQFTTRDALLDTLRK